MFRRILVPLDGSARAEQALPIAARIARASGGSVMLLHVLTATREFGPSLGQAALQHEVIDAALADATTYLSKAAQAHSLVGVETKVAVLSGPEALTILATAKEQQSDLILIASHGATGFKRWALGSVAQKVARESLCPYSPSAIEGLSPQVRIQIRLVLCIPLLQWLHSMAPRWLRLRSCPLPTWLLHWRLQHQAHCISRGSCSDQVLMPY